MLKKFYGLVARFFFGFRSGSWANDFFLPFISLRDDGLFSNRRAKKSAILAGFNG